MIKIKKKIIKRRKKRNSEVILPSKEVIKDCLCYPRTILFPAFITKNKFNSFIERIK